MLKVTYFNRDKRKGNYSIEELFLTIRKGLRGKILMSDYFYSGYSRIKSILTVPKFQGDVNHITGDVNFLAYGLKPSRTILTIHDVGHFELTLKGWKRIVYKYLWMQWPLNRVAVITTISEFTKGRLVKYFKIPEHKIQVIHNPCPDNFVFTPKDFNEEKPTILQIGSGRNKNINRLIDAIDGINCVLVLIRTPDLSIEKKLQERGIEYVWRSELTYEEVINEYNKCDVLFFASEYEGFGMPILEANSVGRAVITGNVTAMPEVAGNAACIVDPYNVASIRAGIVKVINEKEYREKLILNGRENIKRFDLSIITQQYLDLYLKVAKV